MSWFRVDDLLNGHRKARKVRRSHPTKKRDVAPFGLWTMAGSWCGRNRTGGWVPVEVLEEWDDDWEALSGRLVDAKLWTPEEVDGEPGFRFNDWTDMNPAEGEDQADYGRRGNHVRWHEKRGVVDPACPFCTPTRGDIGGDRRGDTPPDSPRPVPTRPDPTSSRDPMPQPQPVDNSVPIEILAGKLRRFTALRAIRTDKLKPDQTARLMALIEIHGDDRLVEHAVRTLRRDEPPQTIQAFLGTWEALPPPGGPALAVVPDQPCPVPGHTGTTRHCVGCAADAHATPKENR